MSPSYPLPFRTLTATAVALACGAFVACSTSSPPASPDSSTGILGDGGAPDATTPADSGKTSDGGDAGAPDAAGDAPGDAGEDAAPVLSCDGYCTAVLNACQGSEAQYQSKDECLAACALFPVGAITDMSGDTLGCRNYHAGLAATLPDPHCWHAGPFGATACGADCEDFCLLATGACGADAGLEAGAPYAPLSDCMSACGAYPLADGGRGFGDAGPPFRAYSADGPARGNSLDCREYHLGLALAGGPGAPGFATECGFAAQDSGDGDAGCN